MSDMPADRPGLVDPIYQVEVRTHGRVSWDQLKQLNQEIKQMSARLGVPVIMGPGTGGPADPILEDLLDHVAQVEEEQRPWRMFSLTFDRVARRVYTQDHRLSTQVVRDLQTQFPRAGQIKRWSVSRCDAPSIRVHPELMWDGARCRWVLENSDGQRRYSPAG